MNPTNKKATAGGSGSKLPVRSNPSDLSAQSLTTQQILEQADQAVARWKKRLTVATGETGAYGIEVVRCMATFCDQYLQAVREHLRGHPRDIPGWKLETQSRRTVSRDTVKVFEAITREVPDLEPEEFLNATQASISGLTR